MSLISCSECGQEGLGGQFRRDVHDDEYMFQSSISRLGPNLSRLIRGDWHRGELAMLADCHD